MFTACGCRKIDPGRLQAQAPCPEGEGGKSGCRTTMIRLRGSAVELIGIGACRRGVGFRLVACGNGGAGGQQTEGKCGEEGFHNRL